MSAWNQSVDDTFERRMYITLMTHIVQNFCADKTMYPKPMLNYRTNPFNLYMKTTTPHIPNLRKYPGWNISCCISHKGSRKSSIVYNEKLRNIDAHAELNLLGKYARRIRMSRYKFLFTGILEPCAKLCSPELLANIRAFSRISWLIADGNQFGAALKEKIDSLPKRRDKPDIPYDLSVIDAELFDAHSMISCVLNFGMTIGLLVHEMFTFFSSHQLTRSHLLGSSFIYRIFSYLSNNANSPIITNLNDLHNVKLNSVHNRILAVQQFLTFYRQPIIRERDRLNHLNSLLKKTLLRKQHRDNLEQQKGECINILGRYLLEYSRLRNNLRDSLTKLNKFLNLMVYFGYFLRY